MTNPTPHGQVPDTLIDLIDTYAETRHRYGRIHNARTEAARNAVIEALSGVQALSAAPAVDITTAGEMQAFEAWYKQDRVIEGAAAKMAAKAAWKARAMLAASPTPPAEQATPKAAPGDAIDEAMRERDDAEDFIDALLDEVLGHERPEWSNLYGRADALNDVQERMTSLHKPAVDKAWGQFQSAMAAPQQEAQEPVNGWSVEATIYKRRDEWVLELSGTINDCAFTCRHTQPGYLQPEDVAGLPSLYSEGTAPQPAPAPLSDDVVRDAARYRWLRATTNYVTSNGERIDVRNMPETWDVAIDAALAAQGGK